MRRGAPRRRSGNRRSQWRHGRHRWHAIKQHDRRFETETWKTGQHGRHPNHHATCKQAMAPCVAAIAVPRRCGRRMPVVHPGASHRHGTAMRALGGGLHVRGSRRRAKGRCGYCRCAGCEHGPSQHRQRKDEAESRGMRTHQHPPSIVAPRAPLNRGAGCMRLAAHAHDCESTQSPFTLMSPGQDPP